MPADGGVGNVGQAEFAEEAALFFFRHFAARGDGQKAIERQFERFGARDFGLERAADHGRAAAEDADLHALTMRIAEQDFFGRRALRGAGRCAAGWKAACRVWFRRARPE